MEVSGGGVRNSLAFHPCGYFGYEQFSAGQVIQGLKYFGLRKKLFGVPDSHPEPELFRVNTKIVRDESYQELQMSSISLQMNS